MRSKVFVLAGFAAALATGAIAETRHYEVAVTPMASPSGYQKLRVEKAAIGSTPIRIWANTAIEPDCSARTPGATLTILRPPAHGVAEIKTEPFYAAFPPGNPRAACNHRKVPGNQAFYTAASGYAGRDELVLQGSSPDGVVRRITVDVTVR